jgi:uncharacterized protein YfaS (alpha-2-macroglobulin family)
MDESGRAAQPYLQRLEQMEQSSDDGRLVWWEHAGARQTMFYGAGRSGSIETTALAALAMIKSGTSSQATRGALTWLIEQKDSRGTWHSTQATVLALRALLAGTGKPLGDDKRRLIDVAIDGQSVRELTVPADQGEVMQQLSLSEQLAKGRHRVTLAERSGTAAGYQVALSYYLPESYRPPLQQEPLSIDIAYECTELTVDETVAVRATLVNKMPITAPMVILDLPIPPGFMVDVAGLDRLAESGAIAKYQLTPRSVVVYLRELPPSEPLELRYRLRATMPVKVAVAPARAYEYYDPDRRVVSAGAELTVVARQ